MSTGNIKLIAGAEFVEVIIPEGMSLLKNYDISHNAEIIIHATADVSKKVIFHPREKDYIKISAGEKLWAKCTSSQSVNMGWICYE